MFKGVSQECKMVEVDVSPCKTGQVKDAHKQNKSHATDK